MSGKPRGTITWFAHNGGFLFRANAWTKEGYSTTVFSSEFEAKAWLRRWINITFGDVP
jgi:hypothetical protein